MAEPYDTLISRLSIKQAQLEKANTALSDILDGEIDEYKFSDQTGRQEAVNLKIESLEKVIRRLQTEIDGINQRLYGKKIGYQRLRR